ncbi:hypothetical protein [Ruminococcus sp.]|uniref:hypothetical protein n=1 Tax=Ruminococcus sp. TaxID=41978 RepID=UPI001B67B4FE|nr:hypothetical protein [Ruminococcus sp.]MBP5433744.1 hypothetical protein [Ruminococcus sp.]
MTREQVCSQQIHCLSCPISSSSTGKDCRELSSAEIEAIMTEYRKQEAEGNGIKICYH